MNAALTPEQRADLLLHAMRFEEKVALLHGLDPSPVEGYAGYVPPNPRLQIPALTEADGRAGVGNGAKDVTLLPAPIAAASSWDPALLKRFGQVLGNEEWGKGTNVALAPTMDIVRVPEWGRSFESYGEDPYLNAQLAVAEIQGIQSQGPIANANMYLMMNEENKRLERNTSVDLRTLYEIYLPPFAAAVQQGHVGTVMCAYVKTNGTYSCENPFLLNDLLTKQLGFSGWVMSDWGATHSTALSLNAGLDQEMPGGYFYNPLSIHTAFQQKIVDRSTLDEHVHRILVTMFRFGLFDKQPTGTWDSNVRTPAHDQFAREVAEQGTVLLKNDHGILPLSPSQRIAIVGLPGKLKPLGEGEGSSGVVASYVVSPFEGIRRRIGQGAQIEYDDGTDIARAAQIAQQVQVVIIFVGGSETEGEDRANLQLPGQQDALISAVAHANPNTIVVLNTGGVVLMPWIAQVRGVIEAWYSGQEDGNAVAAILFGDVNPSAKLPLTFPRLASEVPTSTQEQWPGTNGNSLYSERLQVGYRWYDANHVEPLFPFGYGLSYTTFHLSHLAVEPRKWRDDADGPGVQVRVQVTNTGKRAGAEVVQVYVEQPVSNGEPPRQLRAFTKVMLQPGESQNVMLPLEPHSFSIYDGNLRQWKTPAGDYKIWVGDSSRNLLLEQVISVSNDK